MSIQASNSALLSSKSPSRAFSTGSLVQSEGKPPANELKTLRAASATRQDRIIFSSEATKVQELTQEAIAVDTVRLDRVDELRARIDAGTFRPDAKEIANAILKTES